MRTESRTTRVACLSTPAQGGGTKSSAASEQPVEVLIGSLLVAALLLSSAAGHAAPKVTVRPSCETGFGGAPRTAAWRSASRAAPRRGEASLIALSNDRAPAQ